MVSSVRFIFLQVFQHFNKAGIVLRHHDAEPYKFSIQALEGGTVTDYQALADAGFKNIIRGKAWFQDLKKNEVCIGGIDLISWNGLQFFDHSCALRKDQFTGLADIVFILEHDLAGKGAHAVKRPWSLFLPHFGKEIHVSGDAVTQTHSRGCEEFGYASEYHEIGEFTCQWDGGDSADIRGKFYVSFVDHYEDIFFRTEADEAAKIFLSDRRGSWVVGIAEDKEIITLFQFLTEIRDVRFEIVIFLKMIVFLRAS